jgi:hypothetical protein
MQPLIQPRPGALLMRFWLAVAVLVLAAAIALSGGNHRAAAPKPGACAATSNVRHNDGRGMAARASARRSQKAEFARSLDGVGA